MANVLSKRFETLTSEGLEIEAGRWKERDPFDGEIVERIKTNLLLSWKVKVKNLLIKACGDKSLHFTQFEAVESGAYLSELDNLRRMMAVLAAARDDFDGGYITTIRELVQAEIFESELEQATELLQKGFKTPAAVIAGTVLETSLRELCVRNQLKPSKLDRMNADLAKKGIYGLLIQKRLTALAQIRNDAAHGRSDQFTDVDVKSMIADTERFLADHLSS
jgi:hypothetical protein